MKKVILKIEGMSCSACQNRIEKYLNKQDGVEARVNLVMANATILYDEEKNTLEDLERYIKESGYKSLGIYKENGEHQEDNSKINIIVFGILLIILMYISMSHMLHLPIFSFLHMLNNPTNYGFALLILTIPFLYYGFDIIKSGIEKLFKGHPNMDSLVTVGVLSSLIYSIINLILIILGNNSLVKHLYFESIAMIIYFIKLGRLIDKNSKNKTKEAIKELVQITPQSALLKTIDGEKEITIDEVKKGDILIAKPGMKIAVDGSIVKGKAHLNEAFITGESLPSKKGKEDKVIAGSINVDGYIEYQAEKIGPESTISEIVRLVLEATSSKAPISRIADIVSSYFVPSIFLIASLTFLINIIMGQNFNDSLISFVTVLVVACPCALGLATPLAMVVSVGESAKDGILIKSSETMEEAYKVDTIIFDKTGTLTYGDLRVSKIYNYSKYSDKKILNLVSNLEKKSTHPLATAFKEQKQEIEVSDFKNISGIGLYGVMNQKQYYIGNNKLFALININNKYQNDEETLKKRGNSLLYVIEDKKVIALIGVCDIIRENAKQTIKELKKMNKDIIMLSGDNKTTANLIASQIGIEKVIAEVMPKDKERTIQQLKSNNHKVMMVGDGINDATSLVSSDIGISLNSGTDIALDSADVLLIQNDLSKIVTLLKVSKRTITIVKQNLFWAFIYNILMIPIAIGLFKNVGISISPMLASLSMTISSLTVIANSLRLKKTLDKDTQ